MNKMVKMGFLYLFKLGYVAVVCTLIFAFFSGTIVVQAASEEGIIEADTPGNQYSDASEQVFDDVELGQHYFEAVAQLVELGIVTKNNKFNPDNELTRGQMAKMIALALNLDGENVSNPNFKDVPTTHQFYPYIAALVNKGIVNGYPDGTYGVSKKVTHAHMAKFIVNGFQLTASESVNFSSPSVKKDTEVYKNFATANFYEIMESHYEPNENLIRSDAALIIANAINEKNLDEVRIPLKELGVELAEDVHLYSDFENLKEHLVIRRVDKLNNELVLSPLGKGKTGIIVTNQGNDGTVIIQLDIDENLQLTYQLTKELKLAYKQATPFEFYLGRYSDVRNMYFEKLTGTKEKYELLFEDVKDEEEGFEMIYVFSNDPGQSFKVTFEYLDGKKEEVFLKSVEADTYVELVEVVK